MNTLKSLLLFFVLSTPAILYAQEKSLNDTTALPDKTIKNVEEEAFYPGGEKAWRIFLEKKLNPNIPVKNGAPVGKYMVYMQFVIDKDGSVSGIKPLTNWGYGMEEEFTRVLNESGRWTPAKLNGKPLRAFRKQPITFFVTDDRFNIKSKEKYVLFTEMDNELIVEARRVKYEDMELKIDQGTIMPGTNGKFIARVNKSGRVIIDVYDKRRNKKIGAVSFEVKDKGEQSTKN